MTGEAVGGEWKGRAMAAREGAERTDGERGRKKKRLDWYSAYIDEQADSILITAWKARNCRLAREKWQQASYWPITASDGRTGSSPPVLGIGRPSVGSENTDYSEHRASSRSRSLMIPYYSILADYLLKLLLSIHGYTRC